MNKKTIITLALTTITITLLYKGYSSTPQWRLFQQITSPSPEEQSPVPDDWKSYSSNEYGFSFSYPPTAQLRIESTSPLVVAVFELGNNQKGATELYDGLSVSFQVLPITSGMTLKQTLDAYVADQDANGITLVKEPSPISINGYSGYDYTLNGLGEYTTLALPLANNTHYISITNSSADYQGTFYQEIGKQLISTLRTTTNH